MIKYLIIILSLIYLGCSPSNPLKSRSTISEKERFGNEVLAKAAALIKRETGLQPAGFGGRAMDEVKMLMLAFTYNHPVNIEEGRKLLVYAVETFLSVINDDERVRPYLYNYPFEPKNITIQIDIRNPNQSSTEFEKISFLVIRRGVIEYRIEDPYTVGLKTIHEETFAEAKEKLKENHD